MNFESIIWIYILLIILACIIPVVRTISIKKKIRKLSDNMKTP